MRNPSATEQLIAAIERDKYWQSAVLDNSQAAPEYSLKTSLYFGGFILLSMLTGVAVGFWGTK